MLFSLKPKETRKELFGRDRELEELHRLIRTDWVIILGRRMTGKTSLLKTFLREVNGIYINLLGVNSIRGFLYELSKHVSRREYSIDLKIFKLSISSLVDDLFSQLDGRVIGLDEVQDLPSNYFLKLLKRVWDTYDVKIVFTGSMVGVIKCLLEPKPSNPLYGRKPIVMKLKPFTRDMSRDFLIRGFRECGVEISDLEIEEVIERLNGFVGWLTYYGNFRCIRGLDHYSALEQVYGEGKGVMLEELKRFLSTRRDPRRYILLLKTLPATWSELRNRLNVNNKILRDMLRSLENAFLIEKIGRTYTIPDPVLKRLILEL